MLPERGLEDTGPAFEEPGVWASRAEEK
jgi:hypothetical protein